MSFPETPKFPGAVAGEADLLNHKNLLPSEDSPVLASGIGALDLSFATDSGAGARLPAEQFVVSLDDEIILVGSRSGDVCSSLTRGFEGTTPAAHSSGTSVQARITAKAHNQLASEINAIEAQLGIGMGNVATTSGASDGQIPTFDASANKYIPKESNGVVTLVAGENVSSFSAVVCIGGLAHNADANTLSHAGKVVGVSISSALTGHTIRIQQIGLVNNSGFHFTAGEPVYVGLDGALTQALGVGLFEQSMGVALSASDLEVQISKVTLYA